MKRYIYLLIILFIITLNGITQQTSELFSIPGLEFGIVYIDSYSNNLTSNRSIYYEKDTIIDGKKYIEYAHSRYPILKEYFHIDGHKVYYKLQDTNELIYDFGLNVGDIFSNYYKVIKKENWILPDGRERIFIRLQFQSSDYVVDWLEGIGDLEHSITKENYIHKFDIKFVCAKINDLELLTNKFYDFDCDSLTCKHAINQAVVVPKGNQIECFNQSSNYKDFYWDFGDGHTSNEMNPVHTYERPGCKTVSLHTESFCNSTINSTHLFSICTKREWKEDQVLKLQDNISSITYVNANTYWAYSYKNVYYTNDNGMSFTKITAQNLVKNMFSICSIIANENFVGIYCIKNINHKYYDQFYTSSDNGNTWELKKSIKLNYFYGNKNIFIYNDNNFKSKTNVSTDYGNTWKEINLPSYSEINSFCIYENNVWVVIHNNKAEPDLYNNISYSINEGRQWVTNKIPKFKIYQYVDLNTMYLLTSKNEVILLSNKMSALKKVHQYEELKYINQLIFKNEKVGYVKYNNTLEFTNDGGQTWEKQNCANINLNILNVDFSNNFYSIENNKILRYKPTVAGPGCSQEVTPENSNHYTCIVNPNPVISGDNIIIGNVSLRSFTVEIYDLLGHRIKSEFLNEGENTINTSGIFSGNYFLKINDIESNQYYSCIIQII